MKTDLKGGFKNSDSLNNLTKEGKMGKKKKPEIDGIGIIIIIAGLSLFFFGNEKSTVNAGLVTIIIGLIRTLYVLLR